MNSSTSLKIEIQNINTPGKTTKVDREKYTVMKNALLEILPDSQPGLTHKEIKEKVKPYLPESLFPGGSKTGWWSKTVQLDLEAKGVVVRNNTKPLTWHKSSRS